MTLEFFVEKKKIENSIKQQKEKQLEELLKEKDVAVASEEVIKKYSEFMTEENLYKYAFKELIKEVIINKDRTIIIKFNFNISKNREIKLTS